MNFWVQIGIGCIPSMLILMLFLIFWEKSRRMVLELILLFLVISGGSILIGTHYFQDRKSNEEIDSQSIDAEKASQMVMKMAGDGDISSANELLNRTMNDNGYTAEYTLNLAKLYALKQDYQGALVLYKKVLSSEEKVSDSEDAINDAISQLESVTDLEVIDEGLLKSGIMGAEFTADDASGNEVHIIADEKLKVAQDNKKKQDNVHKYFQNLAKGYSGGNEADSEYLQMAEIISATELLYQSKLLGTAVENDEWEEEKEDTGVLRDFMDGYGISGDDAKAGNLNTPKLLRDKFNSLVKQYPELESLAEVRYTRLKLSLLLNDYNSLAQNISNYTDYKEYMVIANLYLNGYIDKNAFGAGYGNDLKEMYGEVAKQLEKVYKRKFTGASKANKEEIEKYIKDIKNAAKNPVIGKVNYQLLDYTNQNLKDNTKIYLLLAEIAQSNDNASAADEYITKSIDSVGNCEDESFTEPMGKLVRLITQNGNTDVKNVSEYVQAVLENQSVIDINQDLLRKNTPYSEDEENMEEKVEDDKSRNEGFDSFFTDYVSKKSISVHITDIDASGFETVRTCFTVSDGIGYTVDDIKGIIGLYDCGVNISDFNIEKVTFDKFYTLLCCDTSGSMAGEAIENLKSAVSLFISNQGEKDDIALLEFNDQPVQILPFGSSADELQGEAEQIEASGGTNMYDSALSALEQFPANNNTLKCIILMSDGQDNNPHSREEIESNIGKMAKEKNIVIYTIGLGGEVDSDYLSAIAESTGGNYVYVNDSRSLYKFYELLNNQNKNQYQVTYTAVDTLTETDRECRIILNVDTLSYDAKYYSLGDVDANHSNSMTGKSVRGLESRLMYKNNNAVQKNTLFGSGFAKEDSVRVMLCGNQEYDLNAVYASETEYGLTIPINVPCGTYDIMVQINGKIAYLKEELIIVNEGDLKTTFFGKYKFTSFRKEEYEGTTILSGYVKMNDWLNFHGSIVLEGDMSGESIILHDMLGGYVRFDKENSYWLGRYMANQHIDMPIVPFNEIALYNKEAEGSMDPYVAAVNATTNYYVKNVIELKEPSVALYPDRIELDINKFVTKLNEQYKLFNADQKKTDEIFTFEHEEKAVISGENIGLNIDLNWRDADEDNYHTLQIGNMPFHFNNKKIHFVLNSVATDTAEKCPTIEFEYQTKIAFLDMDSAGFDIKLKGSNDSIKLSDVGFSVDKKVNFVVAQIPCSLGDFQLKLADLDKGGPTKWTWKGGTDISAGDVAGVLPRLEKYIGNVTIVKMDDAIIEGRMSDFYLKFSTSFKFLEGFDIGKLELTLGNISYTNALLDMDNEKVKGYIGKFSNDLSWKREHCNISLSGSSEISITDRFIGIRESGKGDIMFKWWISKKFSASGEVSVGMYKDSLGRLNFGIWSKEKKIKGEETIRIFYWNKEESFQYEQQKL